MPQPAVAKPEICSVAFIKEQRGHFAGVSASGMRRNISNAAPQSGQRYSYIGIPQVYFTAMEVAIYRQIPDGFDVDESLAESPRYHL